MSSENSASEIFNSIPSELLKFDRIFIHKDCWESEVAKRFKRLFAKSQIQKVDSEPFADSTYKGTLTKSDFDRSKKNIYICNFKGEFFKKCPGAHKRMACCNYFVLNLGLQCNMNCSYCYLQSFINTPVMTIYANIDQALRELDELVSDFKGMSVRIGTGEVIDSLSLDPLTLYSKSLIEFFRTRPNLLLEFKTKSDYVDQFLDVPHARNVIVSWSINPQNIIEAEEHGTACLTARVQAALKCVQKDFRLSFHIDPVIWHPEWQMNYGELVDLICDTFNPKDIPYISLGALRFQTEQRYIMKERFGMNSLVNSAEMFVGRDGKLRYDQDVRNQMFKFIIDRFKAHDPKWNVFLCMESPETWLATFEATPRKVEGLEDLFSPRHLQP